ncbi:YolD-like family protein [Saccharibacillus sacchari]|uniref:YolD-like family protein n=1 Tax=Saccharibacillus sacchari TaxID=456493 RepID=A0ACC6PES6_9BACL
MTKKLEGNGIWESSRMILPEYRERIIRASAERDKKPRIILHQDEHDHIAEAIKRSLALRLSVRFRVHGDSSDEWVEGIVIDASPMRGTLRLQSGSGMRRIAYSDITGAESTEE